MRFKYAVKKKKNKNGVTKKINTKRAHYVLKMLIRLSCLLLHANTKRTKRKKNEKKIICISMTLFVAVTSHVAYIMYKFACTNHHMNANRVVTWRQKMCVFFSSVLLLLLVYECFRCTKEFSIHIICYKFATHERRLRVFYIVGGLLYNDPPPTSMIKILAPLGKLVQFIFWLQCKSRWDFRR